ncbi:GntR family transcriptional regulator [Ruania rhizosphaerae]|uniref:GntR family transcriptional regulator n=1 Tax=Ruania rhizosphaerae TaxID=1840413 RepID=UPI00135856CA|nr:GntR family transcriptional regulator [Ruania rhizosphaerae]
MAESEDTSVAERCYLRLREAILRGRYTPGERLTSVRLATDLGISRTPVRTALHRLKADGLVDMEDNRAAWVRPLTVDAVEQAYEIAMALEGMLVRKLAAHVSPEQGDALDRAIARMEDAAQTGDQQEWVAGDEEFHHLLRTLGGNPLLDSMLERVETVIHRVRFLSLNIRPEGAIISAREHRAMHEALVAGDGDGARSVHEAHLERVRAENIAFLNASFGFMNVPTPTSS